MALHAMCAGDKSVHVLASVTAAAARKTGVCRLHVVPSILMLAMSGSTSSLGAREFTHAPCCSGAPSGSCRPQGYAHIKRNHALIHRAGAAALLSARTMGRVQQRRALCISAAAAVDTSKSPKSQGFTMPGEFEPHEGCWMGWPESEDSQYLWREGGEPARGAYANVAKAISQFEPLYMVANPGEPAANARKVFDDSPNVNVVEVPINDGWTRDWGPSCIARDVDGKREVAGVHWDYDCYGAPGKMSQGRPAMMPNWDKDYNAGRTLLTMNGLPVFEAPIHLEGGSIHSDGQGTMVVTEECLLDPSRNPDLGKEGIEKVLCDYLGLEKIIWLWRGMEGDTEVVNGHVDNMCCFIRPGVVALAWSDNEDDPQHEVGVRNLEVLNNSTDAKGRKLEVFKVHVPPPLFRTYKEAEGVHPDHIKKGYCPRIPGVRMPATYINHYCANGGVVVPQFGGAAAETDRKAIETLQEAYGPDYKVVGVRSREVLLNAGNIHCITQQWVKAG